jgi:hypothetical protein
MSVAVLAPLSRDRPYLTPQVQFALLNSGYFAYSLACDEAEPNHSGNVWPNLGKAMPYRSNLIVAQNPSPGFRDCRSTQAI